MNNIKNMCSELNLVYHINVGIFSLDTIGITHVFSCINICRVPRKLFEREAVRPSVQTSSEDPANVNAMKQTFVTVILALFYLISAQTALKTSFKH